MGILKKPYELSVWDETLGEKGQKETKLIIIGAHDMTYRGRATSLRFIRKINGTNTLTFQLVSKFFDDITEDYIHNEFCDYLFNERKIKLKYGDEWFEFYIKNINETKQSKHVIYSYTCEDAFIDELSRNGYGITFNTELYNNVEELGVFADNILKDSIWTYDASKNWGDFTEYIEEKLFRIPVSQFKKLIGHKIDYKLNERIENVYTGESRFLELGDDLARIKEYYWDNGQFNQGIDLLGEEVTIENDGYIYVPYSCLGFCYIKEDPDNPAATEIAAIWKDKNSYFLAPQTIDPTALIQFISIPYGKEIQIDENGLIVNKDCSYVMTLKEWNENINTKQYFDIENNIEIISEPTKSSNTCVYYEGYLTNLNNTEIAFGKKISISDRTEINISEDIDQYVTVYNNKDTEYNNMYTADDWYGEDLNYRVCSYEKTRVIVPQLARNLVQNGTGISDVSGWEVMTISNNPKDTSSSINLRYDEILKDNSEEIIEPAGLILDTDFLLEESVEDLSIYRTFLNFGIVGQKEKIEKNQTYVLCIDGEWVEKTDKVNSAGSIIYTKKESSTDTLSILIADGGYNSNGDYYLSDNCIKFDYNSFENKKYYFIRPTIDIENPYFAIRLNQNSIFNLTNAQFFRAYTKGEDFFKNIDGIKYKYSGRDIFFDTASNDWIREENMYYRLADEKEFLNETDIIEGSSYAYKKYFRQQLQYQVDNQIKVKDTFKLKSYLNNDIEINGLDPALYTEDDYKIVTDYIDLSKCPHYDCTARINDDDCKHKDGNGICMYQKYGYCPYLFKTQKHCRKIRTLKGEKSNRFNLTQELGKVFEIYPMYYTAHFENGKVKKDENGKVIKNVFYITEKGMENKLGFRYEKNLSNINRTFDSKQIVTKLYVQDVDSELSKTGLCSIKTAEDNPSKDNYIIDFSYYTLKGLLDKEKTDADLYGMNEQDLGYLKTLGYYNNKYDELSNKIINLQDKSFTELTANIEVNLTGIETAQQEMNKIKKNLSRYSKTLNEQNTENVSLEENETYKSYKLKYNEQKNILLSLIENTFMTNGHYGYFEEDNFINDIGSPSDFLKIIDEINFKTFKKQYLDTFKYKNYGMMGQYTAEYKQIQSWKKERAKYLKKINEISLNFYKKYESYLKEGTWSDGNYLSDNTYYFGAKEVAKQGAIPKITYKISVVDLAMLDEDYTFNIADITYIEDIEIFGINQKTGLPNRLKAIISSITYDLDTPSQNLIEIQNYTTQFEDLFQQIASTVQSLNFNENIYKRSANFTATKNINGESLQNSLNDNQLTLLDTEEENIQFDYTGQHGSDINNHNNKYKLDGQGLYFSNNGGQTWNVGVTPKGINADYINVGSLDAGKVQIVDGNYLYFLWDKSGINAYRTPQATAPDKRLFEDFAKFNKYGLSLVEDGKIRLRAGYNYRYGGNSLVEKGDYNKEEELSTENNIGFYLYDNQGQEIFKTEQNNEDSARISLAGEMFITQNLNEAIFTKYIYGYENEEITATIETFQNIGVFENNFILQATLFEEEETFEEYYKNNWIQNNEIKYFSYKLNDNDISYFTSRISKSTNKKVFNEDNYYTETILTFIITPVTYIDGEFMPIEDTEIDSFELALIENNIYVVNQENKNMLVRSNSSYSLTYETDAELVQEEVELLILNNNIYEKSFIQAYVVEMSKNRYCLFNKLLQSGTTEEKEISDGVAIFLNNQAVAENSEKDGYFKRLISCVKQDEDGNIRNILSVLSDGGLYLGGLVQQKDVPASLSKLNDHIKIDTSGKNNEAIVVKNGSIKIGGEDLVEGILTVLGSEIESIKSMVQNAGLIEHSHDISGSESYPEQNKPVISKIYSMSIDNNILEHLESTGPGGQINEVVVYGKRYSNSGPPIDGYFSISVEDFFNELKLRIKEGTTTSTTGNVQGVTGGYLSSGYIVEGQ